MALFAELLAVGIDADARGGDAAAFATQCEGGADDCRQADPCPFAFAPRQSLRRVNQWRRIAMSSRVRPRLESCSSSSFLSGFWPDLLTFLAANLAAKTGLSLTSPDF